MNDHHPTMLQATLSRRKALSAIVGLGTVLLAACGSDGAADTLTTAPDVDSNASSATVAGDGQTATTSAAASATGSGECNVLPEETGGPFPADGSNDNGEGAEANVLSDPRSVRQDITTNLDGSKKQEGIPMTIEIHLQDAANGCAPKVGASVYLWHCNRDGHYSVYSGGMNGGDFSEDQFFRGVQPADADGIVRFTTIVPGRYSGRASHIHFRVYSDSSLASELLTSQFGFDDAEVDAIYAVDAAYSSSLRNPTYNSTDNVFGDGNGTQIMDTTGDASAAIVATINVSI